MHFFAVVATTTAQQEATSCAFDSLCVLASKSLSLLQEFVPVQTIETNDFKKKKILCLFFSWQKKINSSVISMKLA